MKKIIFLLAAISFSSFAQTDKNVDKYAACIKQSSIKYAKLDEKTETIARAAVASCSAEMQKAAESNEFWQYASPETKANLIAKMKDAGETLSIKTVLDERVK